MLTRVHVFGAAGYAAAEFIRLSLRHPFLQLGALESESHSGELLGDHFPLLRNCSRQFDPPGTILGCLEADDVVVLASAQGVARSIVPRILAGGARAIDLSADFRLTMHSDGAIYGFPERYRQRIAQANLIANPGCYPTAVLLATLPLASCLGLRHIIVDAKSGISGAGRNPRVGSLFAEVDGEVLAYGLDGHRHQTEIEQEWRSAKLNAELTFTPHVVPIHRGMLVDAYCIFDRATDISRIRAQFGQQYEGNPFVRLLPVDCAPSLAAVRGTNDAELHLSQRGSVIRVICAIDNLGKGAAGPALQNLNLMLGYPEETALGTRAIAC